MVKYRGGQKAGERDSFLIPVPKGVYQASGDTNVNADYAYIAENMRTERGLLATSYGTSRAFPALGYPIETLTRFYRRNRPDDPEVFVAAANGSIYTYTMGTEAWVERSSGYASDNWSYVTYEAQEDGETVDILIMSNAYDGMIAIYGNDPGMTDPTRLAEGYPVHMDSIIWDPAFVKGAFSVSEVGQWSEPVLGSYGVHIVYYLRDVPAGAVELTDEMYATLYDEMLVSAEDELFNTQMQAWFEESEIEYSTELTGE